MMIKNLVHDQDPILYNKVEVIDLSNPQIDLEEIDNILIKNMNYYEGVGLSANQIGIPYKVFSLLHEGKPLTMFNPKILEVSSDYVQDLEGCLTYPGLYVKIMRPKTIVVSYYDKEKNNFQGYFSDLSSRIIQHEMDHMQGKVFYDSASNFNLNQAKKKRKITLRKMKEKNSVLWQSHINNRKLKKSFQKTL